MIVELEALALVHLAILLSAQDDAGQALESEALAPELEHPIGDVGVEPIGDGDDSDDRRDSDQDPQNREERPELAGAKRGEGEGYGLGEGHDALSPSRSARRSRCVRRGCG